MNLDCPPTAGQKRSIESAATNTINNEEVEIINLKKRCIDLEKRVETLENKCLGEFTSFNSIHIFRCLLLVISQQATNFQDVFHDIMQCSNSNIDFIMLNNNDLDKVNNDDIVTINNNSIPINKGNNASVNDNNIVVTTNNDDTVKGNNIDDIAITNNNLDFVTKRNNDNTTKNPVEILNI